ncbi:hypothetical protein SS50377_23917 [Spironucleus salmonicida]|uniref:Uncharacterized protein n=1 Tax=Spironucleus salmonicida TaxID=348837 RepID=V6LUK9_9EUKA|nr:hypothetical protein SS50377_23917 [Spironucleus salmonicida]|eukprot:EST48312.1 Hypothetical protein SS50377_11513 [Spironucleus salmonicida]
MTNFEFSDSDDADLAKNPYSTENDRLQQILGFNNSDYYDELEKIRQSCADLKNEYLVENDDLCSQPATKQPLPKCENLLISEFDRDPTAKIYALTRSFALQLSKLHQNLNSEASQKNLMQLIQAVQNFDLERPLFAQSNDSKTSANQVSQPDHALFFEHAAQQYFTKKFKYPIQFPLEIINRGISYQARAYTPQLIFGKEAQNVIETDHFKGIFNKIINSAPEPISQFELNAIYCVLVFLLFNNSELFVQKQNFQNFIKQVTFMVFAESTPKTALIRIQTATGIHYFTGVVGIPYNFSMPLLPICKEYQQRKSGIKEVWWDSQAMVAVLEQVLSMLRNWVWMRLM